MILPPFPEEFKVPVLSHTKIPVLCNSGLFFVRVTIERTLRPDKIFKYNQRLVSVKRLFGKKHHDPPQKFPLNREENLAFSIAIGHLKCLQRRTTNPFNFRRGKNVVKSAKKRHLGFSETRQDLVNSGHKFPYPEMFGNSNCS